MGSPYLGPIRSAAYVSEAQWCFHIVLKEGYNRLIDPNEILAVGDYILHKDAKPIREAGCGPQTVAKKFEKNLRFAGQIMEDSILLASAWVGARSGGNGPRRPFAFASPTTQSGFRVQDRVMSNTHQAFERLFLLPSRFSLS